MLFVVEQILAAAEPDRASLKVPRGHQSWLLHTGLGQSPAGPCAGR